jgi:hypothetical protein
MGARFQPSSYSTKQDVAMINHFPIRDQERLEPCEKVQAGAVAPGNIA